MVKEKGTKSQSQKQEEKQPAQTKYQAPSTIEEAKPAAAP
jgi:hypothetical protein